MLVMFAQSEVPELIPPELQQMPRGCELGRGRHVGLPIARLRCYRYFHAPARAP